MAWRLFIDLTFLPCTVTSAPLDLVLKKISLRSSTVTYGGGRAFSIVSPIKGFGINCQFLEKRLLTSMSLNIN